MRSDITPGGTFPDYALSDHTDTVRTLSELQGRDPLILMLSRGHYCPKEHQQHLEMAAFQSKVAVKLNRPTEAMGFPFYLSTRRGGENRLTRLVSACN